MKKSIAENLKIILVLMEKFRLLFVINEIISKVHVITKLMLSEMHE